MHKTLFQKALQIAQMAKFHYYSPIIFRMKKIIMGIIASTDILQFRLTIIFFQLQNSSRKSEGKRT